MADTEYEYHVHDEFINEILKDENIQKKFPELLEALKLADTEITPEPPAGGPGDGARGPGLGPVPSFFRPETVIRIVLKAIQETPEFKRAREILPEDLQKKLDDFLDGKSLDELFAAESHTGGARARGAVRHAEVADDVATPVGAPAREHFQALAEKLSVTTLDDVKIKAASDVTFQNWGLTVKNTPSTTSVPTKKNQIIQLVKDAKAKGQRIRASGYRHSWTDLFSQNNASLISMLDIETVTKLPDLAAIERDPDYQGNELKTIELAEDPRNPDVAYITLGSAVTNEDLRRWLIDPRKGASKWTMPIQVIMVEITIGGSNAPICHGAGIHTKTLSDLVVGMEYVDANGVLRELSDPALLRAASGCFGLLGIVTSLTLKLDRMTGALMDPRTQDLLLAIPPPVSYYSKLPAELQKRLKKIPAATLEQARKDFIEVAEKKYYSEWFWFPYQTDAYINAWDNDTNLDGMVTSPGSLEVFLQWLFNWGGGILNDMKWFQKTAPKFQCALMGTFAMLTMPKKKVKTQLINALHFRRGIQNMRVGDFEVEIPIPALEPRTAPMQTRNWDLVQRAWWDGIIAMYNDSTNASARIALEMRITGDSNVILAPQRGNSLGTASIEVVTSMPAVEDPKGIWSGIKQTLANVWLGYKDADGVNLRVRPHWAKEWTDTKAFGKDWVEYLRETHYKEEIEEFKKVLGDIGKQEGWTLDDLQQRFSNPLLDRLIFGGK